MYCEETSKSKFSCLHEKQRFNNTAFIRRIRKKYLSYFEFRLSWKEGHISSYHRVFYQCPRCLKSFIKKRILDFHLVSCWLDDGKEDKYEQAHMCPFCGQFYVSLLALKRHKRCHKEKQVSTLKSNNGLLRNAESQNHVTKQLRELSCPHCHNSFTRKSFVMHKKHNQKSLGKSHQCQLCGLHFLYLCQFMDHSLIHERIEKNLKKQVREKLQSCVVRGSCEFHDCRICGKSFRTLNEVTGHLEDHLQKPHDLERGQKKVSFDLLLGNESWQKAALLQCIDDMKPRKLFVEHSNIIEKDEKIINCNSNNLQKSVSSRKNFTKSPAKERNSVNHTTVCHSKNELYANKFCLSIQNSGISEKDILDTAYHVRPKSPEIKHNQLIDSRSANSQEISTAQKDAVGRIDDSKTVPRNISKDISKDSDLLKDYWKEDHLKSSDASVNNDLMTCNVKGMNDVAGKDYAQFIQAESEGHYESKSASEVIYQNRDNTKSYKTKYLKCPACHVYFEKVAFSIHVSEHKKDGWYICQDCGLSFWCVENLKEHCLSNHPGEAANSKKGVNLVRNKKKSITKSKKKKVSRTTSHDKKYHCSVCDSGFKNWKDFLNHVFHQKNVEKCITKLEKKNEAITKLEEKNQAITKLEEKNQAITKLEEKNQAIARLEEKNQAITKLEEKNQAITKLEEKNEAMTNPHDKKYFCGVCDSGYIDWKDFLNHVFPEKRGEIHCSKLNTTCMDENQKSLLKRADEEYFQDEKFISKWRKCFQIDREVKVLVEMMVPCKDCGEYYGTTDEDHQKHQMIHAKSKSENFFGF